MKSSRLRTAIQLAKNIRTTGALYQTSKKVEREIGSKLSDQEGGIFVEFGLGHGNITKATLNRISSTSKLYSFEVNPEFCEHVSALIKDDRLVIINDGAENIAKHISDPVDGIVSSIPITIFPKELQDSIFSSAYIALKSGAYFSQILYSNRKKMFQPHFDEVEIKRLINLPLEYIHHCRRNN